MASFSSIISFLTLAIFSLAAAAPSQADTGVAHITADDYVTVFDGQSLQTRGLGQGVCGGDLDDLANTIKSDVQNVVAKFGEVIDEIKSKTACGCKFDGAILELLNAANKLVLDLIQKILSINWFCVKIELCFELAHAFCDILNCLIKFAGCLLAYIIHVKLEIAAEVWKLIFAIPLAFIHCLEEIAKGVIVFKLIVIGIIGSLKACLQALIPHCGCQVSI